MRYVDLNANKTKNKKKFYFYFFYFVYLPIHTKMTSQENANNYFYNTDTPDNVSLSTTN